MDGEMGRERGEMGRERGEMGRERGEGELMFEGKGEGEEWVLRWWFEGM